MNKAVLLIRVAATVFLLAATIIAPRWTVAQTFPVHPETISTTASSTPARNITTIQIPMRMMATGNQLKFSSATFGDSHTAGIDPVITSVTHISDPYNKGGDQFGFSVALSADGSTALIGAWVTPNLTNGTVGRAYVFNRVNGVWSTTPSATFENPLSIPGTQFGDTVALSADGSTAIISDGYDPLSPQTNFSRVYIYTRTNGVWNLAPVTALMDPGASDADCFGCSGLALSADGSAALIGAQGASVNGNDNAGEAYIFASNNGVWSSTPVATFSDPDAVQGDFFGDGVALSADGETVLISTAPGFAFARAFIFKAANGIWPSQPTASFNDLGAPNGNGLGVSVALSGDGTEAIVGTSAVSNNAGAAYVFNSENNEWPSTPTAIFDDPDEVAGVWFGLSAALSGDGSTALIGAPQATSSHGGAVYVFTRASGVWAIKPDTTIIDPGLSFYDAFGNSVALSADGSVALVGSPQPTGAALPPPNPPPSTNGPGQAYIYEAPNGWIHPSSPPSNNSASSSGSGTFDWLSITLLLGMLIGRKYSVRVAGEGREQSRRYCVGQAMLSRGREQ